MSIQLDNRTKLHPILSFYSYSSIKLHLGIIFPVESLVTDQSFKDESDINTIMQRYQSTGEMPYLNEGTAQWLDATGHDFQAHMDFVLDAQQLFDELPSAIRDRFGNDPAAFLNFTSDPDNTVEIAKMGLLTPETADAILNPVPVPPAPAAE